MMNGHEKTKRADLPIRSSKVGSGTTQMASTTQMVSVDPIACEAYGYCAELLGEIITLDEWGYPIVRDGSVPRSLISMAKKAARDCPRRALLLSGANSRRAG
jgi:ferredoxin